MGRGSRVSETRAGPQAWRRVRGPIEVRTSERSLWAGGRGAPVAPPYRGSGPGYSHRLKESKSRPGPRTGLSPPRGAAPTPAARAPLSRPGRGDGPVSRGAGPPLPPGPEKRGGAPWLGLKCSNLKTVGA